MIEFIIEKMHDGQLMAMLLAAIAAGATVFTLVMPLLATDQLGKRMKSVADERERIRQRERERMARTEKVSLRQSPKQVVQKVVENFNLTKWLAQESAREKLVMAGYRGQAPYVTFLFFRLIMPIVALLGTAIYVFLISKSDSSTFLKVGYCIGATYLGMQAPMLYLRNGIKKRQLSIKRAFPDALDLLLICVESGMSVEVAFRKVSTEIGTQSIAARRGVHADDCRALLPAGPQGRLREPRQAHRDRRRQGGHHGAEPVGTLRHAARQLAARHGPGKP